ncbi:response regulator transcription factor (plasmid) [Lichenicola cladoniae]|uniref:Response regulator transcription factor n=1 Tax=Lichenicola cladoniae TaxID=1484109 RepID=A0A6M8HZ12_9PROT|nr:response regulator [Lichenicola cladoniae]NPD70030.1 response regulator transcription factor [Acetobacteraceae bacterium]QKE93385.1 response regulator transcription factor [Lichenicola cladoniae]
MLRGGAKLKTNQEARGSEQEAVHIIDDDTSVRSALVNLLESAGLKACSYGSVDAFLHKSSNINAGCLLIDIRLPGLNGLEFLGKMTGLGLRMPAILITGHGDIPMTVKGMRAGAIDFLTKPFHASEVIAAVSTALIIDRSRRVDDNARASLVASYESLTPRERQVMALVTAGKMNKQVAGDLNLSEITVKIHRGTLMKKMGVRTLPDLVRSAERLRHVIQKSAISSASGLTAASDRVAGVHIVQNALADCERH